MFLKVFANTLEAMESRMNNREIRKLPGISKSEEIMLYFKALAAPTTPMAKHTALCELKEALETKFIRVWNDFPDDEREQCLKILIDTAQTAVSDVMLNAVLDVIGGIANMTVVNSNQTWDGCKQLCLMYINGESSKSALAALKLFYLAPRIFGKEANYRLVSIIEFFKRCYQKEELREKVVESYTHFIVDNYAPEDTSPEAKDFIETCTSDVVKTMKKKGYTKRSFKVLYILSSQDPFLMDGKMNSVVDICSKIIKDKNIEKEDRLKALQTLAVLIHEEIEKVNKNTNIIKTVVHICFTLLCEVRDAEYIWMQRDNSTDEKEEILAHEASKSLVMILSAAREKSYNIMKATYKMFQKKDDWRTMRGGLRGIANLVQLFPTNFLEELDTYLSYFADQTKHDSVRVQFEACFAIGECSKKLGLIMVKRQHEKIFKTLTDVLKSTDCTRIVYQVGTALTHFFGTSAEKQVINNVTFYMETMTAVFENIVAKELDHFSHIVLDTFMMTARHLPQPLRPIIKKFTKLFEKWILKCLKVAKSMKRETLFVYLVECVTNLQIATGEEICQVSIKTLEEAATFLETITVQDVQFRRVLSKVKELCEAINFESEPIFLQLVEKLIEANGYCYENGSLTKYDDCLDNKEFAAQMLVEIDAGLKDRKFALRVFEHLRENFKATNCDDDLRHAIAFQSIFTTFISQVVEYGFAKDMACVLVKDSKELLETKNDNKVAHVRIATVTSVIICCGGDNLPAETYDALFKIGSSQLDMYIRSAEEIEEFHNRRNVVALTLYLPDKLRARLNMIRQLYQTTLSGMGYAINNYAVDFLNRTAVYFEKWDNESKQAHLGLIAMIIIYISKALCSVPGSKDEIKNVNKLDVVELTSRMVCGFNPVFENAMNLPCVEVRRMAMQVLFGMAKLVGIIPGLLELLLTYTAALLDVIEYYNGDNSDRNPGSRGFALRSIVYLFEFAEGTHSILISAKKRFVSWMATQTVQMEEANAYRYFIKEYNSGREDVFGDKYFIIPQALRAALLAITVGIPVGEHDDLRHEMTMIVVDLWSRNPVDDVKFMVEMAELHEKEERVFRKIITTEDKDRTGKWYFADNL